MGQREPRRSTGLGAIALVLVAVVLWWVFSGNGPQGPQGNDVRLAGPDVDATSEAGSPTPADPPDAPRAFRIESYAAQGTALLLRYLAGGSGCPGSLGTPRLLETDAAVTVTLPIVPPDASPARCDDPSRSETVQVTLGSPLGDRSVLDGSANPLVRVEEAAE